MNLHNNCGIYTITSPSGRQYVGSARNFTKRWYAHRKALSEGRHHCIQLQRACDKYGLQALKFEKILICDRADLIACEQEQIDARNFRSLYNSAPIAGSNTGHKFSAETKARMSAAKKGKRASEETKARMSAYSKARTPEHLAALAKSQTGKRASEATRAKQAAAKRGRSQTPEHVAKVVAALLRTTRKDNVSGVRGVSRSGNKWNARIRLNGAYKNLGRFDTIEAAAAAVAAAR